MSKCPSRQVLAQLGSGSLDEKTADIIFSHLDGCESCQASIDEIARQTDNLLALAKTDSSTNDQPALSHLIRKAQQIADETRYDMRGDSKSGKSISLERFIRALQRSKLLSAAELNDAVSGYDESDSSDSLANELVKGKLLTSFQARALLKGRYKGLVLGKYLILDKLGKGGMGRVFKAQNRETGEHVCVKVLNSIGRKSQKALDRFSNEAKLLSALSHPNIVVAHDAGEEEGLPFLAMELVEAPDLSEFIKANGPLSERAALRAMLETARALQYSHQKGVIHRDVKPHNLLYKASKEGKPTIKVLDLGLARFDSLLSDWNDASIVGAMTNTGVVMGTVDYISPEQALDSRQADARSDIYSLGCTLFFLLTGRPPFGGDTLMSRLVAHREKPIPPLRKHAKVSEETEHIVNLMLAKKPEDRYQSMAELVIDLKRVLENQKPKKPLEVNSESVVTTVATDNSLEFLNSVEFEIKVEDHPPSVIRSSGSDSESTIAKSPTKNRGKQRMMAISILGIVAAGVFTVVALVMINQGLGFSNLLQSIGLDSSQDKSKQLQKPLANNMRSGRDLAARNGGEGRALIVVSHLSFDEKEFGAIADAFQAKNVDVVTTSPVFGTNREDFGLKIREEKTDGIKLEDANAEDFDAIVFISGENWPLTHKVPKTHKIIKRLVDSCADEDNFVATVGSGINVVKDSNVFGKLKSHYDKETGIDILHSEKKKTKVFKIDHGKEPQLVEQLIKQFAKK